MIQWFLHSNNIWARILRTLVEAGLTAIITYTPEIIQFITDTTGWIIPDVWKAVIITLVPAILTAVLNAMGEAVVAASAKKAAKKLAQQQKENDNV